MSNNNTDIFGIDELVTESGVLGEYKTSAEIRVRFVVENAQSSNQFSIYGRIRGQTAWEAAGSFTGNATTDITVAQYDFIMVICDIFASDSNNVHFLASGIAQSSTGISSITAGGHSLVGLDNITLTSNDSTVTLTSSTQTGVIDLSVSSISGLTSTVGHLNTLSGVPVNADNLGTFTGTIVPDNTTIKNAIQSLETSIGALPDPMEYKGLWSAATNTPTLTDGTGNNGDVYQVTANGSVNFGHGAIVFAAGDKCVYNGATALYEKWYMNDAVSSVNGYTGAVSLVKGDVGLGNVLNVDTTIASNITQDATHRFTNDTDVTRLALTSGTNTGDQDLSGFVPNTRTINGHALSSDVTVSKSDVGLANVDNTSDINKPVSTAQQTALNLKEDTITILPISKGGTNATSQSAPAGGISPIAYFDGTKITTDTTPSHLGYDDSTDTVYSSHINIASASTQTAKFTNTAASSSTGGAGMSGFSDDGTALATGDRLGFYTLGGAKDSSHTTTNSIAISAFATENWNGTSAGASLVVETTPNGSVNRQAVVTFGQDKSAIFTGAVNLNSKTASKIVTTDASKNLDTTLTATTDVTLASNSDSNIPSEKAVKTYADTKQVAGDYITALTGDVTASGPGSSAATISNAAVIGKVLTGYSAAAGTVSSADSILTAIQKIDANTTAVASTSHNGLSGLQGGTTGQYYHLTSAQATIATQAATSLVDGYLTSTDWSTFNNKASVISGDILPSSFSITNNQIAAANVTGFAFSSAAIRSFTAHVSVIINATTNKYETFNILGLQKNGSFDITVDGLGDNSGILFSITSAGQITYTSTNNAGFTSGTIKFRALTTPV